MKNTRRGKAARAYTNNTMPQALPAGAEMKPMSKDVKRRRWKIIGHILRQDQNSDCNIAMTWAPEEKREEDQRLPGGVQLKKKEKKQNGNHGTTRGL